MTSTVAYEKGISEVPQRAYGYSPQDSTAQAFDQTDQSMTSSVLGDGGMYSSVDDLCRWDRALSTERLVPRQFLDEAFTPHATSDDGTVRYGYGWMVGEWKGSTMLYHSGSTVGFRTFIARVPERKTTVIVLINRADGNAEKLGRGLLDLTDRL
jgi:CubicO group peptidase (beta-lactamase class C family)